MGPYIRLIEEAEPERDGHPGRAARLGRAAATNLRTLLSEGGIGEGLKGLVQGRELVRDADEAFGVLEPPVQRVHLVAEAVEALENCVKLTIVQVLSLHPA